MSNAKAMQLLHTHGTNVIGDEWQWSAELVRRDDGQVLLLLVPTMIAGTKITPPWPIVIDGGAHLFDRLSTAWYDCTDDRINEVEWQAVAVKVSGFDKALGAGLKAWLRQEHDRPEPPSEAEVWFQNAVHRPARNSGKRAHRR